ncbi:MAG: hypothetical protein FJZ57_02425 [Chlamydiae bacterium]|nr:hypothetical protein [Chlamydiota bacterium]
MYNKKTYSIFIGLSGLTLVALSIYAKNYIRGFKGIINGFTSFFKDNPVGHFLGGEINKKASAYDTLITGSFWAGLILFFLGAVMFWINIKKKK